MRTKDYIFTEVINKIKEKTITEEDIREFTSYNYATASNIIAYLKIFKELYFNQRQDLIRILINTSGSTYNRLFHYFFDDRVEKTKENYTKTLSVFNKYINLDIINEIIDFVDKVDVLYYLVGLEDTYFNHISTLLFKAELNPLFDNKYSGFSGYDRFGKIEIDSIHFEYLKPVQILKIYEKCDEEEKNKCLKKIKKLPFNSFTINFNSDNIAEQIDIYNNYPPLTILEISHFDQILKDKYNYANGFDASFECYSKLVDYHKQNQDITNKDLFFEIIYENKIPYYAKEDLRKYDYQSEIIVNDIFEFKKYIEKCKFYGRTDIKIILRSPNIHKNENVEYSEAEERELYKIEYYENAYIDFGGLEEDGYLSISQFKRALNFYDGVVDYINHYDLSEVEKYFVLYFLTKTFKKYEIYKGDKEIDREYYWISRNPYLIIHNLYIVCKGYTNFMAIIGKKIGLNIKGIVLSNGRGSGHSRLITKINDLKYDLKGIYIGDPTADTDDLFSFKNVLLTNEDAKKELDEQRNNEEVYKYGYYMLSDDIMEMFDQNTKLYLLSLKLYDKPIKLQEAFANSLGNKIDNMKLIEIFHNILEKIYPDDEVKTDNILKEVIKSSNLDCIELNKQNSIESCSWKLYKFYNKINLTEDGTRYFTYDGLVDNSENYLWGMDSNKDTKRKYCQLRFFLSDESLDEDDLTNLQDILNEAFANDDRVDFRYGKKDLEFEDLNMYYMARHMEFLLQQFGNTIPKEKPSEKLYIYIKADKDEKLDDFDKKLMEIRAKTEVIINNYCSSKKISK